jgi:hypothetical protein
MFYEQMLAAIDGARTLARLDELSRTIWQAFGTGAVSDEEAQGLAERIHAVRGVTRKAIVPVGIPAGRGTLFPPRRAQVAPDRAASRTRRRRLASAGPMPPALATGFTQGELAALAIIAAEIRAKGLCGASLAEIAARAGVGRTTAQNAIREAARQGLVTVQERRHEGRKNDPNIIRIVSREWCAWLKRGGRGHQVANGDLIGAAPLQPPSVQKFEPHGIPREKGYRKGRGSDGRERA